MRVARIALHEIGPFEDAILEMPPPPDKGGEVFLFEGPNGSGKTTLAEAIACSAAREPMDSHPLMPPEKTLLSRLRPDGWLRVDVSNEGETWPVLASRREGRITLPGGYGSTGLHGPLDQAASGAHHAPIDWAAFAYGQATTTPGIETSGPQEIAAPPLRGALAFGRGDWAASYLGQLLVNLRHQLGESALSALDAEGRATSSDAVRAARLAGDGARRTMTAMEQGLSVLLGRAVRFKFGAERTRADGGFSPEILFDGEPVPLHLLGEGMRRTLSWLADLLVRLHRVKWVDDSRSPSEQSFWLILDEVDESLHPTMQMRMLPALRGLFPNASIYMTTHSPFVVASAGEGFVIPLRPDAQHRIRGPLRVEPLHPGQSLEWVIEEVFEAKTGFIDAGSRRALDDHKTDISRLRRKEALTEAEWQRMLERRKRLMSFGDELASVVAVLEVPVRALIEARESARGDAREVAR
jgi:energy-coupling factor transporter ATP-binding protein EcfA2